MSIKEDGCVGENMARAFFKKKGNNVFFEIDWCLRRKSGEWLQIEVKHKELFTAGGRCEFDGHGMDNYKVRRRLDFENEFGIRAYLLVFCKTNKKIYGQYLKKLEDGRYFDTFKGIRVYDIASFDILEDMNI